jgi:hypothetical protein
VSGTGVDAVAVPPPVRAGVCGDLQSCVKVSFIETLRSFQAQLQPQCHPQ